MSKGIKIMMETPTETTGSSLTPVCRLGNLHRTEQGPLNVSKMVGLEQFVGLLALGSGFNPSA